jgi:hypothetical protein
MLFLAKEYPDSLHADLLASINAVKALNLTPTKEEKELQKMIQDQLLIPLNSATHDRSCLVILNRLTYDVLAHYMFDKK